MDSRYKYGYENKYYIYFYKGISSYDYGGWKVQNLHFESKGWKLLQNQEDQMFHFKDNQV